MNTIKNNSAIKQVVLNMNLSERDLLAAAFGHNKIDGYTIETKKLSSKDNDYEISVRKNGYEKPIIMFSFDMIEIDLYEATIQIDMLEFQSQHSTSMIDVFKFITKRLDHILKNVMVNNPETVYSLPISYITVQEKEEVNFEKISLLDLLYRFRIDRVQLEMNESRGTFSFLDLNNSGRILLSINLNELSPEMTTHNGVSKNVIEYYFYPNQLEIAAEQIKLDNYCFDCEGGMDDEGVAYLELDTFRDLEDFDIQKAVEVSELYQLLKEEYVSSVKKEKERIQRSKDSLKNFLEKKIF